MRNHDGARVVGRVKRSPVVQRLLYQPLASEERPLLRPEDEVTVRELLRGEVVGLQRDLALPLADRWGYV